MKRRNIGIGCGGGKVNAGCEGIGGKRKEELVKKEEVLVKEVLVDVYM